MRHHQDQCLQAGCTGYLSKPVQKDTLLAALHQAAAAAPAPARAP
jgi:CheY-like chemotaxis protein